MAQLDRATKDTDDMRQAITDMAEKMDARATEGREAQRALTTHLDAQFRHLHDAIALIASTAQDHEKRLRAVEGAT